MKQLSMLRQVALLVAAPAGLMAQTEGLRGVRLVEYDDGMVSGVYAFARAEMGPILSIDERGILFDRDPSLLFVCLEGKIAVVYRFDTDLLGENDAVRIQFRFAEQPPSEARAWPLNHDPRTAAEMEVGVAALGAESSNPLIQMFSGMADAARMPPEYTPEFLHAARAAAQVTLRVTDPVDGESHMDVFSLMGFGEAIERVTQRCQQ